MANRITIHAPAKTNLFLAVGEAQDSGYHSVRTILCPLGLHDVLMLEPASSGAPSTLESLGRSRHIPVEKNLAMRALRAMQSAFARPSDEFSLTLVKRIPSGAGLGGGSSDAAAVIAGVAHVWGIASDDPRLNEVARGLGADVPFFLYGGAAYMDGRGDHFVRSYAVPRLEVALVKPRSPVPTSKAYAMFDELVASSASGEPGVSGVLDEHEEACQYADLTVALEEGRADLVPSAIYNNMEQAAIRIAPAIKDILAYAQEVPGISRAFVSGSGSAVAILCKDQSVVETVCRRASRDGHWNAPTFTQSQGVTIVQEDSE